MIKIANEASIIVLKKVSIIIDWIRTWIRIFQNVQETDFYLRSSLTPSPHHKSTINIYKLINFCSPGLFIPCPSSYPKQIG